MCIDGFGGSSYWWQLGYKLVRGRGERRCVLMALEVLAIIESGAISLCGGGGSEVGSDGFGGASYC